MLICEIGQNWCGKIGLALELIDLAQEGGADLVKFQLYDHKKLYKDHPEIPNVELSFEQAKDLFEYGQTVGIEVFFSVFDVERVGWCEEIGVKRYKIASLMNDEGVINAVRATGKDIIESTVRGRRFSYPHKALYCPTGYPQTDINLHNLKWADGYSDHTVGIELAKVVMAHGAGISFDNRYPIIEKHFSIAHDVGIDGAWSMTPSELKQLKTFESLVRQVL